MTEPTPIIVRRVKMTDDLWDALTLIAESNDQNVSDVIRLACVAYAKKMGVPVKPALVIGRGRRGLGRVRDRDA